MKRAGGLLRNGLNKIDGHQAEEVSTSQINH